MHQDVGEAADGRREVRVERHVEGVVPELLLVLQDPRTEVQRHLGVGEWVSEPGQAVRHRASCWAVSEWTDLPSCRQLSKAGQPGGGQGHLCQGPHGTAMRLAEGTGCPRPSPAKGKCRSRPRLSRLPHGSSTENRVGAGNRKMLEGLPTQSGRPASQALWARRGGTPAGLRAAGEEPILPAVYPHGHCQEQGEEGNCFCSAPSPARGWGGHVAPGAAGLVRTQRPPPPCGRIGREEERPGRPATQSNMSGGSLALPLRPWPGLWWWLTSCPRALMPACRRPHLHPGTSVPVKGGNASPPVSTILVPDDLCWGQDPEVSVLKNFHRAGVLTGAQEETWSCCRDPVNSLRPGSPAAWAPWPQTLKLFALCP